MRLMRETLKAERPEGGWGREESSREREEDIEELRVRKVEEQS